MASRTGSARVFFEIVGQFQAERLLKDAEASAVVTQAIWLDAAGGIIEAFEFAFDGIRDLVEENIESFEAYEEQLIQVKKFYQGVDEDIEKFADASMRLGETFAFSGAEALKAAAQMAQMKTVLGSPEAVIAGTEMGLLFAEIGNMDTQLAMKRMTSLMQQTGFALGGLTQAQYDNLEAETQANLVRGNTMRVLDQLNTIENSSVATMEDMTFVLNQFSAQGNLAGESMATMAAFAALLLEAGEETSRAGTGLRMIFSRLAVDGGDASTAIAEVVPHLDATTVSTMSLSSVLEELIPYYVQLNDIEKIRLTQAIAGNRHYVKLQKVIENHERFITLTGMAYSGAYPAVEEFENRQESMKFKIDKANAMIENQRALVGENLAQAYVDSLEPQYRFLKALGAATDETDRYSASLGGLSFSVKSTIENIMLLGAVVEQLTLPLNFVMGLGNIAISMKAFGAINRQTAQMQAFHTEAYGRRIYMAEQTAQMEIATAYKIDDAYRQTHFDMMARRKQSVTVRKAQIAGEQASITKLRQANRDLANEQLQLNMTVGKDVTKSLQIQRQIEGNKQLISQHLQQKRLKEQELQTDSIIFQQRMSYQEGMNAYYNMSVGQRANQVKQQSALSGAIQNTFNNMAKEVVVFRALTDTEKEHLQTRMDSLQVDAVKIQLSLSENRLRLQTENLTDKKTQALRELIAAEEEHLRNIGQEIAMGQATLIADEKRIENIKREKVETSSLKMALDSLHGSREANLKTMRKAVTAGSGLLGLYAMTTKNSEQMEAALYGVILAQGIYQGALYASNLAQKNYTKGAIMAKMATNVFYGVIVAATAYIGGKMIANVLDLNSSFEDLSSSTADMTNHFSDLLGVTKELSMKTDESILGGIVDASYNDLRQSRALTLETQQTLQQSLDGYQSVMDEFDESSTDPIYLSAKEASGIATQALREVDTILAAHTGAAGAAASFVDKEMAELQRSVMSGENVILNTLLPGESPTGDPTTQIGTYYSDFYLMIEGMKTQYFATEEEMLAAREKYMSEQAAIITDKSADIEEAYELLYGSILDTTESAVSDTMGVITDALDDINEFANAREELFFGNQANFQGAIYKQITQGGVESVLHRVEIIQHNHFNGMTLPEMISQVTEGVMTEMRGQGVPI
jgi:TP901 family phage tail tape measure protein